MPWLLSTVSPKAPGIGVVKLGQPVPLSNFTVLLNSGVSQPAHVKTPGRFSYSSAHEPGRSVPC